MNEYIKNSILCISSVLLLLSLFGALNIDSKNDFSGGNEHIAFVLDVSHSMNVADIGGESRLRAAKSKIYSILQEFEGYNFSVSIFAGESLRVLPFTSDISLVATFIDGLDSRNLIKQGSAIDLGIQDALKSFGKEKTGTIIVLSDGSDDKTLIEQDIKKLLQEQFIDLIVIGIGTPEGGYIPSGDFFEPYKIHNGQRVISRINETGLKDLAGNLGGKYQDLDDSVILDGGDITRENSSNTQWSLYLASLLWGIFLSISLWEIYRKK